MSSTPARNCASTTRRAEAPRAGNPRRVQPHHLVTWRHRWYLVAWDLDREDWRTFRVDRIQPRTPTGPRFTPRELPGGDVSTFITSRFRGNDGTTTDWPCQAKSSSASRPPTSRPSPRTESSRNSAPATAGSSSAPGHGPDSPPPSAASTPISTSSAHPDWPPHSQTSPPATPARPAPQDQRPARRRENETHHAAQALRTSSQGGGRLQRPHCRRDWGGPQSPLRRRGFPAACRPRVSCCGWCDHGAGAVLGSPVRRALPERLGGGNTGSPSSPPPGARSSASPPQTSVSLDLLRVSPAASAARAPGFWRRHGCGGVVATARVGGPGGSSGWARPAAVAR